MIESIAHHVAELVTVFDAAGNLLRVNEAVERLLGWRRSDWTGRHAVELAHPDDLALGMELLSSAKATGPGVKEPVVYRLAHRDGSWVELECIASNVRLGDGQLLLVVTGRPARQMRPSGAIFDEAAARVSSMFDDATIAMAQVGLDGSILRANRSMEELVGAGPGELLGRSTSEIVRASIGVDGSDFRPLAARPSQKEQVRIERHDGAVRHARVSWSLVDDHREPPCTSRCRPRT